MLAHRVDLGDEGIPVTPTQSPRSTARLRTHHESDRLTVDAFFTDLLIS
jgi:hypothetical protein